MSVQPHIVCKYAGHFVLVLQGRVCWQAIKGRKVCEWYSIYNHALNFLHPILLHQQPFLYCHAMCWHTHTHKSCIGDYFLPTSLSTAVPYKDTPSPDHTKPFALVWNSGKVWTRQCILQYNYEEPIILIIILYIIYWQRLFHLRFLKFD